MRIKDMSNLIDIEKMRYTENRIENPETHVEVRSVYEFYPSGRLICRRYCGKSRKSIYHKEYILPRQDMNDFFCAIIQCIHSATVVSTSKGSCSGALQIYYPGGDVVLPGGFGERANDIETIVKGFVGKVEQIVASHRQ